MGPLSHVGALRAREGLRSPRSAAAAPAMTTLEPTKKLRLDIDMDEANPPVNYECNDLFRAARA